MRSDEREALNDLLVALADAFAREGRSGGDQASAALRTACDKPWHPAQASADPGALLALCCKLQGATPLAELIHECRNFIDWTHWEGEGLRDNVSANLFSAELVGPDGHVAAPGVRVGLLVSDKHTDYPVSSHSGEETYLVVSGTAEWIVGDGDYQARPPGSFIHHPSYVPHGRRTNDEPFLGVWRWSGDLDLTSFRVET